VRIRLAPQAEADLSAALEFVRERNPAAAMKLAGKIFATLQLLAAGNVDGPKYRLTTGELVRSWLVAPFRIYYQRRRDELCVLRIYHHARRPIAR